MQIEIERVGDCGLRRGVWRFNLSVGYGAAATLRLDHWEQQGRKTARHKWARDGEGYKVRSHNGHHHYGFCTPAAEVPMPEDVVAEAKAAVLSGMTLEGPTDPAADRRY